MRPTHILGSQYQPQDFAPIDLSINNPKLRNPAIEELDKYVYQQKLEKEVSFLYGGYLEKRALYQSDLFQAEIVRDIHLGIDIWGAAGTAIYAPYSGRIHSYGYNDNGLDYGYTLLLEHHGYYTLYGHLSSDHFDGWREGATVKAGDQIATLGAMNENGGWPPHLHVQKIIDLEGHRGDYPGVCHQDKVGHYRENCPDPTDLLYFIP